MYKDDEVLPQLTDDSEDEDDPKAVAGTSAVNNDEDVDDPDMNENQNR